MNSRREKAKLKRWYEKKERKLIKKKKKKKEEREGMEQNIRKLNK